MGRAAPNVGRCGVRGHGCPHCHTHVFLAASSTQKRGRPTTAGKSDTPLPPMIPGMAGHKAVAEQWAKVVSMCRSALLDMGGDSPRYLHLFRDGPPSQSHLALQDAVGSFLFLSLRPPLGDVLCWFRSAEGLCSTSSPCSPVLLTVGPLHPCWAFTGC